MNKQRWNFERLNVLIVDDNRYMLTLLQEVLRAFGIRNCRAVADPADALEELKHFAVDLIITDWAMEPVGGREFVHLIRTAKDSRNPYVPILALTGHTEMRRVIEARDVGVDEFLAKPVSAKALYERIVSMIENRREFIRTPTYVGPERRRRDDPNYHGPERRADRQNADQKPMSLEDIDKLMNS